MKKYFLITVDTEGDNLWKRVTNPSGMREITTHNSKYIPRFQELCQKYNLIPTYLVNYEMLCDETFVKLSREWLNDDRCEIGMHMHSWNTPPIVTLPFSYKGHNPYAGEYPREIMKKKLIFLTERIESLYGKRPKSHRGGRWYVDPWYILQLKKQGYIIDCSITPGVSWVGCIGNNIGGPDYSKYRMKTFYLDKEKAFLEIPPTIIKAPFVNSCCELIKKPYDYASIMHKKLWLRPNGNNLDEMIYVINKMQKQSIGYLEFMIHSSELMPGGSPTFKNENDIEKLYNDLDAVFSVATTNYIGSTLSNYYDVLKGMKK